MVWIVPCDCRGEWNILCWGGIASAPARTPLSTEFTDYIWIVDCCILKFIFKVTFVVLWGCCGTGLLADEFSMPLLPVEDLAI